MMDRITVVVDTREQEPTASIATKVSAVRKALPAGDYSLVGLEGTGGGGASLTDFVSTVIREKRFHRELEKLSAYESACVVVTECNFRDLVDGRYRSDAHRACADWNGRLHRRRLRCPRLLLLGPAGRLPFCRGVPDTFSPEDREMPKEMRE